MTFSWIDYLNLAENLHKENSTQAERRTSISRAYYYAYHKARVLCVNQLGLNSSDFKGASSHRVVIDKLKLSTDQDLFEIGSKLDALKVRREDADYETVKVFEHTIVNDSIIKAKALAELINNYNP